ncbi:LINE-1 retrotransposable element ORF2 protein [Cucumis melo var. makuwa]|uniref:LINE-1 retrotransposable element ORF2 protein n=1 Tax=Cucumis melo var. makuwa TaxID=1194695 RepID=A0A5D3BPP1_CUCMM|nr:LINE-1 retrotransposable element ORF2 protein [Cucumis melo var. makuwa]
MVHDTEEKTTESIIKHFKTIYVGEKKEQILLENLNWTPIDSSLHVALCSEFKESEIKKALFSFNGNKAPGPDGYTMEFLKKFWNHLKGDVIKVFKDFHEKSIINKNVNNTYIALIAKKSNCANPKDYRSISLATSLYKIIAKAIANRLKSTLPTSISPNQLAFVKGRQITYAILMANEAVDFWITSKTKGYVLKLDIEKAFDKVRWDFIDYMLRVKNYPLKWRSWIKACISSIQYSILINGRPRGKILPNRGLRQGDPISPFIFVIAMDYLSRLLTKLQKNGVIKGVVFDKNCELNYLLFVDDILVFIEDDNRAIKSLQNAIFLFEAASGLTINRSKSSISPVNIPTTRSAEVANLWNFPTKLLPKEYLLVPLGGKPNTKGFWTNIMDKIQKKLSGWKYSQISKGGKLTLIQASLSSLPTYQLSIFKALSGVGKTIEKCWRNFLWKNKNETNCTNLARWSTITTPKCKGGLGITNVKVINTALLCKWLWRFQEEKDSLWVEIISAKYKGHHIGDFPPTIGKYSSMKAPWRQIIKEIGWFQNHSSWEIKDGENLSFWHSNWIASGSLSNTYPRLYTLSKAQNATIEELWDPNTNDWNLHPRRPLNDREIELWTNLKGILKILTLNGGKNNMIWTPNDKGTYTAASAKRQLLSERPTPNLNERNFYETLWKSKLPKKGKFFMWSLFHESINTTDVLQKRLPNTYLQPSRCFLYKSDAEGINHIFISCHLTKTLWDKLSRQIGVNFDIRSINTVSILVGEMKQISRKNVISLNAGVALLWTQYGWKEMRRFSEM